MPKKPTWTDEFSFVNGCVANEELIVFLLSNDELVEKRVDTAMFLAWKNGTWLNAGDQDWACAGVGVDGSATPRLVAVGEFGDVFVRGGGAEEHEKVTDDLKSISSRGPLRCVRTIAKDTYVVGMDRQVYVRSGGSWKSLEAGLKPRTAKPEVTGFESIHGRGRKDLYAVGWEGEIWHFDGRAWTQADSPTNLVLNDVTCTEDGTVYAVGQKGTVIVGRGNSWELIEGLDYDDDLWGVAWHQGQIYVSSMAELLTYDGESLEAVDFGDDEPQTFHKLATGDGVLCSIGAKDVMLHDGRKWIRLE